MGIGASAGGLEAINDFFDNTPPDTGFAFVLVQHLSPDYKSLMPELLSKHTAMTVREMEDGTPLEGNHVYLLPSRKFAFIEGNVLRLQNKVPSATKPNTAIDVFFESLATAFGKKAIGVVLSGTGTDGTKGLEAIKRASGTAMVQDPLTAAFDGMPNSAINAGLADLILAPDVMMNELIEYLKESKALKMFQLNSYRDEALLRDILMLVRNETGQDFSYYKRPTLFRRLSKRLLELNISKLRDYLNYLHNHPEEIKLIGQDFLINVTYFFRDREAFDIIQNTVIPGIFADKKPGDIVKVWSIACSSGEEAYSLAILFHEYIEKRKLYDVTLKIFATDIDRESLDRAAKGIYPKSSLRDVSRERIVRFFVAEGENYRILPEIRKMIVFSYHDVLKDPPFSRMDLILCRNMLIYIGADAQREVIRKIHFALNVEGYLVLGPSEHLGTAAGYMREVDKKWRVFRSLTKARFGDSEQLFSPLDRGSFMPAAQPKVKNPLHHMPELFRDTLLEEHRFAGIYVDVNFEVKQATGAYKQFLDLPDAGFNFNLMKLVNPELGIALNIALRRAMKENGTVTMRNVKVKSGKKDRVISIIVKPYLKQKEYNDQFLFVVLSDEKEKDLTLARVKGSPADERMVEALENELRETRENLQAVIEEVEAANEELQSTNEEMISTNEELQSTNEELQSLNEELHTVSAEHQQKIRELVGLNDDLNNFLRNSNVGKVLIDHNLIIRRFSPPVTKLINLIDSDVNRSILDIKTKLETVDLVHEIRMVMKSDQMLEKEVVADGRTYLMRLNTYVKQDGTRDGVVVSFVDVTELHGLNEMMHAILDSSPSSICALKAIRDEEGSILDFEYIATNRSHSRIEGITDGELVGTRLKQKGDDELISHYRKFMDQEEPFYYERYDEKRERWYDVVLVKLMDGLVVTSTDVTDRKKAADMVARSFEDLKQTSKKLRNMNVRLEQSNMDLLQFASVASHDLKEPLRKIQTFGNLLMSKARAKLNETEAKYLEKIVSASGRMQRLIEDVLTLSKLSNRDQEFEPVDLNKVVQMIRDDLEITVKERNATIDVRDLPVVLGIGGQMHQVFQNLISNALKFTDGAPPEILITHRELSREEAREQGLRPFAYDCVTVKDNGIGFDEAYKEKIFGIFQRLNGGEYDGTGIGLAICKKIMENHNGYIRAESEPGKGSSFHLLLPRKNNASAASMPRVSSAQQN